MLCSILLLPLLWYGLAEDQGLFCYFAWIWKKFGVVPYVGFYDVNFPGIYLIHYFILTVFGESATAFRAFDLSWQAATVLMIYIISIRIFQNRGSGLIAASFYAISYVNLGAWNTGQRDGFLLLPYLLSYWLLIRNRLGEPGLGAILISGLLTGFAFLIKPVGAIMALVFLGLTYKNTKSKIMSSFIFVLACAAPFLAVVVYYSAIGELGALYQALVVFSFKVYSGSLVFDLAGMVRGVFLSNFILSNSLMLLGGVLLCVLRKRVPEENKVPAAFLLLVLLAAYLGYLGQAKYFFYHQAPVWGMLCLFGGGGWGLALAYIDEKSPARVKQRGYVLITVLILLNVFFMKPYVRDYLEKALPRSFKEGQLLYPFYNSCYLAARHIEENSRPDDKLQVWGGEAIVNYLAHRQAPSRFPSTWYFILKPKTDLKTPLQKEFEQDLLKAVAKEPPLYFIVELVPRPVFNVVSDKAVLIKDYPAVWEFISKNYMLEKQISFMEIYRRK
jgi:hypothetical protein